MTQCVWREVVSEEFAPRRAADAGRERGWRGRRELPVQQNQMPLEGRPGKPAARAGGVLARHIAVRHDAGGRYAIVRAQLLHQVDERVQLSRGGLAVRKISDQADADPVLVHAAGIAVRPFVLPQPPAADLNLSVAPARRAVVDDEMVPEALAEPLLAMGAIDELGVAA